MWSLANVVYLERDARSFEGCENSVLHLKLLFFKSLFEWINALGLISFASLTDMLDSCNFKV